MQAKRKEEEKAERRRLQLQDRVREHDEKTKIIRNEKNMQLVQASIAQCRQGNFDMWGSASQGAGLPRGCVTVKERASHRKHPVCQESFVYAEGGASFDSGVLRSGKKSLKSLDSRGIGSYSGLPFDIGEWGVGQDVDTAGAVTGGRRAGMNGGECVYGQVGRVPCGREDQNHHPAGLGMEGLHHARSRGAEEGGGSWHLLSDANGKDCCEK